MRGNDNSHKKHNKKDRIITSNSINSVTIVITDSEAKPLPRCSPLHADDGVVPWEEDEGPMQHYLKAAIGDYIGVQYGILRGMLGVFT